MVLRFQSWWTETRPAREHNLADAANTGSTANQHRVVLDIAFHITTGVLQAAVEGQDKVYTVSHVMAPGKPAPLECWDMHVGTSIELLERRITLRTCSQTTQRWIAFHAKRLRGVYKRLLAELAKYDPKAAGSGKVKQTLGASVTGPVGPTRVSARRRGAHSHNSEVYAMSGGFRKSADGQEPRSANLRHILDDIESVRQQLTEYRPKRAVELLKGLYNVSPPPIAARTTRPQATTLYPSDRDRLIRNSLTE